LKSESNFICIISLVCCIINDTTKHGALVVAICSRKRQQHLIYKISIPIERKCFYIYYLEIKDLESGVAHQEVIKNRKSIPFLKTCIGFLYTLELGKAQTKQLHHFWNKWTCSSFTFSSVVKKTKQKMRQV
jgi:hypothetical protein